MAKPAKAINHSRRSSVVMVAMLAAKRDKELPVVRIMCDAFGLFCPRALRRGGLRLLK